MESRGFAVKEFAPGEFGFKDVALTGEHLDQLTQLLRTRSDIKKLTLRGCNVPDAALRKMVAALSESQHPQLVEIDLYSNRITDQGATLLAECIAQHPSLQILNVSTNKLSGAGALALAQPLAAADRLFQLQMDWNGISREVENKIQAMTQACKRFRTTFYRGTALDHQEQNMTGLNLNPVITALSDSFIYHLSLKDCFIGDEEIQRLAPVFAQALFLREINLEGNNVTDVGVAKLLSALAQSDKINSINLERNPITPNAQKQLEEFLQTKLQSQKGTATPEIRVPPISINPHTQPKHSTNWATFFRPVGAGSVIKPQSTDARPMHGMRKSFSED